MPDGTTIEHREETLVEERRTIETILGGTLVGGLLAAGAAVLSIIGLSGAWPIWMLGIAVIAAGASFLFEGAAIASRSSRLLHEATGGTIQMAELGGGTGAETLTGMAGVILGILGLADVYPLYLFPVAAIVFGVGLIFGAGTNVRLNEIELTHKHESPMARHIARQAVRGATGFQIVAGIAGVVLGIVGLASEYPITLSLVAILIVSATFLLSDTAIAGRLLTIFPREG
jgi:hypothetical protein